MTGACTLADHPDATVRVACRKCDRRGQRRRSSLVALSGEKAAPRVFGDDLRRPTNESGPLKRPPSINVIEL